MKAGISIERSGQNDGIQLTTASAPATVNQGGQFRFIDTGHPNTTGVAIGNTALGYFNEYSEISAKPQTPWVATALDWFVQDSWKATRKLTRRTRRPAFHMAPVAQPLGYACNVPSRLL